MCESEVWGQVRELTSGQGDAERHGAGPRPGPAFEPTVAMERAGMGRGNVGDSKWWCRSLHHCRRCPVT